MLSLRSLVRSALALSFLALPAVEAQPASTPTLTLREAGSAPRRALRFAFVAGTSETVTMRQQMGLAMSMDGMDAPSQELPATVMTMRAVVDSVAADGSAFVASEIVDIAVDGSGSLPPEMLDGMRAQLAAARGVTTRYVMSPVGTVSAMTVDGGGAIAAQLESMQQAAAQLSTAFPAEPVGVGGSWTTTQQLTQNGVTLEQVIEYTVVALDDTQVELALAVRQSAADVAVNAPGMPPGASATIRSLEGQGTGRAVIRFGGLQPTSTMQIVAESVIDLEMGGQARTMSQTMTVDITMTPAAAETP